MHIVVRISEYFNNLLSTLKGECMTLNPKYHLFETFFLTSLSPLGGIKTAIKLLYHGKTN